MKILMETQIKMMMFIIIIIMIKQQQRRNKNDNDNGDSINYIKNNGGCQSNNHNMKNTRKKKINHN